MKKFTITALSLFLALLSFSQECESPVSPTLNYDGFINSYVVTWIPPNSGCDVLYYEVEYQTTPFTPGTGEGNLISPVFDTYVDLFAPAEYAWVRSVCDCEGGGAPGEGDGVADNSSPWVEATLIIPIYPDPGVFCPGDALPVSSPEQCGVYQYGPQELNFLAPFEMDGLNDVPCLDEQQYVLWRSFIAPASGAVSVSTSEFPFPSGEAWNNMGVMVGSACGQADFLCVASMANDEQQDVIGLTAGTTYYIGVWANNYPYFYDFGTNYNGVQTQLNVCELEAIPDYSINAEIEVLMECLPSDEFPEYTLGSAWPEETEVTLNATQLDSCGRTLWDIQATDNINTTVSTQQLWTITDDVPPSFELLPPQTLTVSCDDVPAMIPLEVQDNCQSQVNIEMIEVSEDPACEYTITRTWIATDPCGNSSSFEQMITVVDDIAPSFDLAIAEAIELPCGSNPLPIDITATDNCSTASISEESEFFELGCNDELHRTWTATDGCGNEIATTQIITWYDDLALEIVCPDSLVWIGWVPGPFIAPDSLQVVEVIFDECDQNYTLEQSPAPGDLYEDGFLEFVTFTVTDSCGNFNVCEVPLHIEIPDFVQEIKLNKLSVYPNPSSDIVHVDVPSGWDVREVDLIDAKGKIIRRVPIAEASRKIEMRIGDLPKGFYQLVFHDEFGFAIAMAKVLVE